MKKQGIFSFVAILVSLLFVIGGLELLFLIKPRLIPESILFRMSTKRLVAAYGNDPRELVEHLTKNPWLKFKPHAKVYDVVRRHEVSNFSPEWQADEHGFKNDPALLAGREVEVVVLGDSHVEGIGVSADQVFSAKLTRDFGRVTYSLGVEGYGPQQLEGVWRKFGPVVAPKARYVIYCYHENMFMRARTLAEGEMTGRIASRELQDQRIKQANFISESVFLTTLRAGAGSIKRLVLKETTGRFIPEGDIVSMRAFRQFLAERFRAQDEVDLAEWQQGALLSERISFEVITSLRAGVEASGAKLIVFLMPTFDQLRRVLDAGEPIKELSRYAIQRQGARQIADFCRNNGMAVLDGEEAFNQYLDQYFIKEKSQLDFKELPFFKVDEHPGPLGHAQYAEWINHFITQMESAVI